MAASSLSLGGGGYTCDFVDEALEDYHCLICQHVARDPHITSCCGEHHCQSCITSKAFCPHCSAQDFTTMLNVKYQQKITALKVYCTQRESGCKWQGPLSSLDNHTDPALGGCQFLGTKCPNKCGQEVPKAHLKAHLDGECLLRKYNCPYCSYLDTYKTVSGKHMDKCPYFPVRCPNFCGVTCERETLEDHMLMCPLEKVACEFAFAGCKKTFLRDKEEVHLREDQQQHFVLLSKECSRMRTEFQSKMRERDTAIEKMQGEFLRERLDKQKHIKELQHKVEQMEADLRESSENQKSRFFFRFPLHFTMSDFSKLRKETYNKWLSEPMGTHPKGYKFRIIVHPNGVGEGAGTHVSVSFAPHMTKFDSTRKWPVKCALTLQLMNQFHDQDHLTLSDTLTWDIPMANSMIMNLSHLFVKHEDLTWNAKKHTQYLHDKRDTLQFRITKIHLL